MRRAKINCPNVGFMWSQFVRKIPEWTNLLLNCPGTIVSTKTEGIFAPKLVETSQFSNPMVRIMCG